MNTRQEALFNYLLANGDKWVNLKQVALDLQDYYIFDSKTEFNNSTARRTITSDIQVINSNDSIDKIIISGSNGIKIANQQEFDTFIENQYKSIFRKLKRTRIKEAKGKAHFNIKLDENGNSKVIDAFLNEF